MWFPTSPRLRQLAKVVIPFVLIPLLVAFGAIFLPQKRYLLISFGVVILALLLFFADVEHKRIGSRRMVLVSVMTALCIVGRLTPFFKPVTALTVLTALYLGKEAGFLVGALAAVLSNFYFGQGPWTPFQMLAWGLIGLFAGMLAKPLQKNRFLLLLYGFLSGVAYSMLLDVWTVLWYDGGFRLDLYLTALVAALPHTLLYSISNLLFLWWTAKPIGDKLTRIKIKYGI